MGANDRSEDEYTFKYSPAAPDEPIVTIGRAVAWIHGTTAATLDPLERSVDTDALDELFGATARDGAFYRSSGGDDGPTVTFEYEGIAVTVEPERVVIDASIG